MSGGGNSGVPWTVWAVVTILAALIGAYATLNATLRFGKLILKQAFRKEHLS